VIFSGYEIYFSPTHQIYTYLERKKNPKWILSLKLFFFLCEYLIFFRKSLFDRNVLLSTLGYSMQCFYCAIILRAVNLATEGLKHETKHIFMALTKSQSFRACFYTHTPDHITRMSRASYLSLGKTTARWRPLIKASYFNIIWQIFTWKIICIKKEKKRVKRKATQESNSTVWETH